MESKKCSRCNELKSLNEFSMHNSKANEKLRNVCYACHYTKQNFKTFTWKHSSDKEKLDRLKKNFDHFVIKKDGCWDWSGFIRPDGYTRMKFMSRTKSIGAHVVSWMIHKKVLDIGNMHVLHKCDNRKCTNPKHLFLGNYLDNMKDMVLKNRASFAKLTVQQVKNIKKLIEKKKSIFEIADKYKVNRDTIYNIKNGVTWKYVK